MSYLDLHIVVDVSVRLWQWFRTSTGSRTGQHWC